MLSKIDWTLKATDLVMILVVLTAPFLAVFAQKQIERWRARHDAKLWIFKTLMGTRATTLSYNHVQGLNMIDLEFTGDSLNETEVRRLWKEYLDHLCSLPQDAEPQKQALPIWTEKSTDLLADLLVVMGRCVGYNFDRVHIKKGIYSPQGHAMDEFEQRAIRFYLLQLLRGERSLTTLTSLVPPNDDAAKFAARFQKDLLGVLEGTQELGVKLSTRDVAQGGSGVVATKGSP